MGISQRAVYALISPALKVVFKFYQFLLIYFCAGDLTQNLSYAEHAVYL